MNLNHGKVGAPTQILAGLLGMLMLIILGCGVKAMPVAPGQTLPAPVRDLTGKITGDQATLSWTIPAKEKKNAWIPAAVVVYRSRVALKDGDCDHCPLKFDPIAKLSIPGGVAPKMQYVDMLETGFRHTYKVVLIGADEERGEDSNLFAVQP